MLIQSSQLTARPGKNGALGPLVARMRDVLSEASGTQFLAWMAFGGRPYGTYALSARHENYAAMTAAMLPLSAATAWAEIAAEADGVLAAPAESRLAEIVAVAGAVSEPKPITVATTATISGADIAGAMAWSIAIAEQVAAVTGNGMVVATAAAGSMFQIGWLSGVDTAEQLDASNEAISRDARYLEMLGEAGRAGLFVPGSTDRVLLMRMP